MLVLLDSRLPPGPRAAVDRALASLDGGAGCVVFLSDSHRALVVLSGLRLRREADLASLHVTASGCDLIDLIVIRDGRWQSLLCQAPCCLTARTV